MGWDSEAEAKAIAGMVGVTFTKVIGSVGAEQLSFIDSVNDRSVVFWYERPGRVANCARGGGLGLRGAGPGERVRPARVVHVDLLPVRYREGHRDVSPEYSTLVGAAKRRARR
jgi:hypothetical protein